MRILVTGADGQLGQCIRDAANDSIDEYIFTDIDDVDITDREAVKLCLQVNNFDIVINCAAFTDVERAETQEDIALRINGEAVRNLADAAKEFGVTLIHISTDYVFSGDANRPINEEALTAPCGAYGRTKLAGERYIAESGCKALILRTAWLYSEYGRNFVKTMFALTRDRESLKVVVDQIGSPTYARDLAKAIVNIVEKRLYEGREGVYHFSDLGVCSWFDLAAMTARLSGHDGCSISPCHSSEYPSKVERPAYSVLDKTKFMSTFGFEIPYWVDSLSECIKRLREAEND
ncbi:MAG: dTDP-4-dehydrorhamnose reductase [Muribaculaceae bacterium]|nr:dTDP-4-dehydrorhamnose reductase [Muribaculaceae bacterium]